MSEHLIRTSTYIPDPPSPQYFADIAGYTIRLDDKDRVHLSQDINYGHRDSLHIDLDILELLIQHVLKERDRHNNES